MCSSQKAGFSSKKNRALKHGDRPAKGVQYGGVAGHERAGVHLFGLQRERKCANDVGEASSLDQRVDFRSDRKDANRSHAFSPSIIGWVIKQMPPGVVRNLSASRSGSSPTTSPSGMRTPRSTTTFRNRACRPTSTYGSITAFSTFA